MRRKKLAPLQRFSQGANTPAEKSRIARAPGGREICRARATILDETVAVSLGRGARGFIAAGAEGIPRPVALVAVGGYGRAELNRTSDIDFMVFARTARSRWAKPLPYLAKLIYGVLYPLWDIGLKVGHAVRSIDDCVEGRERGHAVQNVAHRGAADHGRPGRCSKKLQKRSSPSASPGFEEKYIAARVEDQATRHAKYGDSAMMQEPNIKNGCGGLRDFSNLLWMAFFKLSHAHAGRFAARDFVSEAERKQLEAAYDFPARADGTALRSAAPARRAGQKFAARRGARARLFRRSPSKAHREIHARPLHAHGEHFSHHAHAGAAPGARRAVAKQNFPCVPGCQKEKNASRRSWTASNSSTARFTPRPTACFRDSPRRLNARLSARAAAADDRCIPISRSSSEPALARDRDFLNDEHVRETFLTILERSRRSRADFARDA